MLRITTVTSAAAATSYYSHADYYLDDNTSPARWHGKAGELLGLHGEVSLEHFAALCNNRHPQTGKQLTAAMRSSRRVAYDFSFSVSKSVSILYSIAGDQRIAKAFRDSVNDTMKLIEQEVAVRVRKGGQDTDRQSRNWLFVDFIHTLSRPIDGIPQPQLHAHAVVFNASFDDHEHEWKAAQIGHIKANAPYYQAVFRAKLAERIQQLGYEIDVGRGDFEVRGVPTAAIDTFSGRKKQVEELARKLGITRPESKAKLGATSREKKAKNLTWEELHDRWLSMLSHDAIKAIYDTHETARARQPELKRGDAAAFQLALDHLLERESVVSERELIAETLRRGLGRTTLEGIREQLERPDLLKATYDGTPMVTTRQVMQEEMELIAIARRGKGSQQPIAGTMPDLDDHLNAGQRGAVRHLLSSPDRFSSIRGAAGVGKTTLLKSAKREMEKHGFHVTVLAPSASASRITLRRDGVADAETLQRFLVDRQMQQRARGGVVILDEASLAGVKDMLQLARLAEQHAFRVALLADRQQHKAISRGHVISVLEDFGGVKSVAVTDILRQQGELKQVVALLSKGETEAAFDRLDAMGAIREQGHDALAREYVAACKEGKSVLAVSPTRAEAMHASQAIRDALRQTGVIGASDRSFDRLVDLYTTEADRRDPATYGRAGLVAQFVRNKGPFKAGERVEVTEANEQILQSHASAFRLFEQATLLIAEGDRIRISSGGRSRGRRFDNGATYAVQGFTPEGDIVLDNGWTVGRDFLHIAHDYVSTSFSSQSRTTDLVLIAQHSPSGLASNQAQAYVSVSRGRAAQIFTQDKQALRSSVAKPDIKRTVRDVMGATANVKPASPLKTRLRAATQYLLRLRQHHAVRRIRHAALDRHTVPRARQIEPSL